jgi:dTDP-4-dehydrorhamnose reductase
MRILIFGRSGQVARALAAVAWPDGWDIRSVGRSSCDLAVAGAAAAAIVAAQPDLVINAAAVLEMAITTADIRRPLLHISTDYVFDGAAAHPYRETDPCNPLSVYGASKLGGEVAIREHQPDHIILRTSWVFSADGANFVRTMLRLGAERDEVRIVGDQYGGPTGAADIAGALAAMAIAISAGSRAFGTFHYAGTPAVNWYGFARTIFDRASARGVRVPEVVTCIGSSEYPTAARRPANSTLDCAAIRKAWRIDQPRWEASLDRCLETLLPNLHNR